MGYNNKIRYSEENNTIASSSLIVLLDSHKEQHSTQQHSATLCSNVFNTHCGNMDYKLMNCLISGTESFQSTERNQTISWSASNTISLTPIDTKSYSSKNTSV